MQIKYQYLHNEASSQPKTARYATWIVYRAKRIPGSLLSLEASLEWRVNVASARPGGVFATLDGWMGGLIRPEEGEHWDVVYVHERVSGTVCVSLSHYCLIHVYTRLDVCQSWDL